MLSAISLAQVYDDRRTWPPCMAWPCTTILVGAHSAIKLQAIELVNHGQPVVGLIEIWARSYPGGQARQPRMTLLHATTPPDPPQTLPCIGARGEVENVPVAGFEGDGDEEETCSPLEVALTRPVKLPGVGVLESGGRVTLEVLLRAGMQETEEAFAEVRACRASTHCEPGVLRACRSQSAPGKASLQGRRFVEGRCRHGLRRTDSCLTTCDQAAVVCVLGVMPPKSLPREVHTAR